MIKYIMSKTTVRQWRTIGGIMKNKIKAELRIDEELCRKAAAVAKHEGLSFNNYVVKLLRGSVAYHERVHGRIASAESQLPSECKIDTE